MDGINKHNQESPGRRISLKDCLDQVDFWVCWGGIVSITLIEVRRPRHCGWHHSLGRDPELYKCREEPECKKSSTHRLKRSHTS